MSQFLKTLSSWPITWGITVATLALFGLEFVFPACGAMLEFDTTTSWVSQIVNLLTCHWMHWTGEHLFWDLGMFVLLCGLCEKINRRRMAMTLLTASIAIPIAVGMWHPEVVSYRGLSGLDTALFGMAVVSFGLAKMRESDRWGMALYFGLLVAMIGKTIHELNFGTLFVESSNFVPVPVAHVVGAVIGVSFGVWQFASERTDGEVQADEPGVNGGSAPLVQEGTF